MKTKFLTSFVLLLGALCLSSCLGDAESETHGTTVVHPSITGGGAGIYADQLTDSLVLYTFDSYKVTLPSDGFLSLASSDNVEVNLPSRYYMLPVIKLKTTANLTGKSRSQDIYVYNKHYEQTLVATYTQVTYMNVNNISDAKDVGDGVVFYSTISGKGIARDSVKFVAYGDWTFENSATPFVSLLSTSGKKGTSKALFSVPENPTGTARTDTVFIVSNGFRQRIVIQQEARTTQTAV